MYGRGLCFELRSDVMSDKVMHAEERLLVRILRLLLFECVYVIKRTEVVMSRRIASVVVQACFELCL